MSFTVNLRQKFLTFFRKNGYKYMKPSKIYNDDPTLFFVNSGMCQLKDVFLGKKDYNFTKLMNYQQCIRAGGKHNDLEEVGLDGYHLTMFEMLGFWELGNLNKEQSIKLAYDFLIMECKLNPDNMYVTYFEGEKNIPRDIETKNIWSKFFSENKIIASSFKDNFWMMGNDGPCGPCTEIHYDLIGNRDASSLVNKSDPNVIEIWNLVFIQFNKTESEFIPLEKQFIDTGMGLERLSMIMQNKSNVYETDTFKYLFGYAQCLTNGDFYTNKFDNNRDKAYRIFVDHIRTVVISLYHGVEFDCNKRGFILRKIFRRLLTNMYLYLNNYTIEQKFNKLLISSLISDLLNYWLEFTHDTKPIHDKLIEEEKLYLGLLKGLSIKYTKYMNKFKDINLVKQKLKESNGIDPEMIENMDKIKFVY